MKKKIISLCLVVALGATAVIGGTLAYFTDVTETKTNVFTSGDVEITLEEPNWVEGAEHNIMPDAYFVKDPTITNTGSEDCYVFLDVTLNKYKSLAPIMAMNAVADEIITEEEFQMFVKNGKFLTADFLGYYYLKDMATLREILDQWFDGIEHENWAIKNFYYDVARDDVNKSGDWLTLRLAYIGEGDATLSAGESVKFMEGFTMPKGVTEAMINNDLTENAFYEGNNFEIDFTAYAIQAQQLADVDVAYTAYFDQNK